MSIRHHPQDELLIGYASGSTNEAISLLVATHLALCPECRRKVSAMEEVGGVLFSDLEPVAVEKNAFEKISARLDTAVPSTKTQIPTNGNSVPEPLRSYIGGGFDTLKWQHIVGGISQYSIFRRGAASVRLIRAMPGSAVAMHTHRGEELTMVMEGGFTDATGHYNRGDVQTTSPAISHSPAAVAGGPCINLAVTDSPLIFQHWPAKIIGKLFRF